jgi:hypothetical protein
MKTQITYRTKLKETSAGEKGFIPKKNFSKHDCSLKPHEHWGYNSDLFPAILKRAHDKTILSRSFVWLNTLPEGITIVNEGFLSKIIVNVEI